MKAVALNQVAELIGATDKNAVISVILKFLTDEGIALDIAFDYVFGDGAFVKFGREIYTEIRG